MHLDNHSDLSERLSQQVEGHVYFDRFNRGRYATDASIYQMMPTGVVVPKHLDDVRVALSICRELESPFLPRGGGTSQCGQTVNHAVVIDNTRHLNGLLELDVENQRCVVEPGIVLDELNRLLKPHGLWFPVDVSTASRATIGGMAANNSCGQRSIYYGTMRNNVHAIDALLANGDEARFEQISSNGSNIPAAIKPLIDQLLAIGVAEKDEIASRFPKVLRRVGGYNIDALTPDPHGNNLSHLLVGSEGTLAYFKSIELKLWPLPLDKVVGVCHFPTFYQAMDAAQHLVKLNPRGVELIDSTLIKLAQDIEIFQPLISRFVRGEPAAILFVEFAFDNHAENLKHLELLHETMADLGFTWKGAGQRWGGVVDAVDGAQQSDINEVRKAGLNIMMSMKSEGKPVSFVEDCAVALPDLAEYTDGLTEIFKRHGTTGTWYAHASVGCLHVRPVLNLKLESDSKKMREIAEEAFDLVLKYKGSHSGEHGDGISRSEFAAKMFGDKMVSTFKTVKEQFDPQNILNPGKIVNAPKMNDRLLFRYGPDYAPATIQPVLDWSGWPDASSGLQGAVEMCNNNGACRKLKGGTMCPSYRVTRNERDVTRGRANSLRLALSGQLGPDALTSSDMYETMKLCVSCKGCKRECPTGVDMARMKIEVLAARGKKQGFSLHQKLIAYLPRYARFIAKFPALFNTINRSTRISKMLAPVTGFSANRVLPSWQRNWFSETESEGSGEEVVLLADTFNTWFEPENLRAAKKVLLAAGYRVHIAQASTSKRLCCGRTYLATGMIEPARLEAQHMIDALTPWVKKGVPIVGLEPSCLLTLRDEFLSLLPGPETQAVANSAYLLEEFIARESNDGRFSLDFAQTKRKVLLHGHCHQKAFGAMDAIHKTLSLVPELEVETVDSSCCGMAGAFGYAVDTHQVSLDMAELDLLPAVRETDATTLILADGTSCRHQIHDGSGRQPIHVAKLLEMALPKASVVL